MINFIIYEKDKTIRKKYSTIISQFFMNEDNKYQIIEFEKFDNKVYNTLKGIDGKKIYIIEIDVPGKSGIEFAREIRINGDWISPIIICSNLVELKKEGFTRQILMLDFIKKDKDLKFNLQEAIKTSWTILETYKSYNFKYLGEYYQIPYDKILYIEKNLNDNYSTLYTKRGKYIVKDCINNIFNKLDDKRFFKSNRSCIVNIDNITSVDFVNNIIYFKNCYINLLSREGKKNLKELIDL